MERFPQLMGIGALLTVFMLGLFDVVGFWGVGVT